MKEKNVSFCSKYFSGWDKLCVALRQSALWYILTLIDEHEREETRQLYVELNNNVEVSDIACSKAQMWSGFYIYIYQLNINCRLL